MANAVLESVMIRILVLGPGVKDCFTNIPMAGWLYILLITGGVIVVILLISIVGSVLCGRRRRKNELVTATATDVEMTLTTVKEPDRNPADAADPTGCQVVQTRSGRQVVTLAGQKQNSSIGGEDSYRNGDDVSIPPSDLNAKDRVIPAPKPLSCEFEDEWAEIDEMIYSNEELLEPSSDDDKLPIPVPIATTNTDYYYVDNIVTPAPLQTTNADEYYVDNIVVPAPLATSSTDDDDCYVDNTVIISPQKNASGGQHERERNFRYDQVLSSNHNPPSNHDHLGSDNNDESIYMNDAAESYFKDLPPPIPPRSPNFIP